jgi:DNA relaxase NicK
LKGENVEKAPKSTKVLRSDVDYLTVTTTTEKASATLLHDLYDLLGQRQMYSNPSRTWRFMGYSGLAFEGVRYGLRGQEAIVMLSGEKAAELWFKVAPNRQRCTRIDLAVTVELAVEDKEVATRAYEAAVDNSSVTSSLVSSSQGGSTVYVGSRHSQFMGRLYDKGSEEGMPAGWIWRYEVECKKPASEAIVSQLLTELNPSEWIASYVSRFFQSRAIIPLFEATNVECAIEIQAKVTSEAKQLEWLRSQVRPTVGRLCVMGLEDEVRAALNLPATKIDWAAQQQEFEL